MASVSGTITLTQDPQESFWIERNSGKFQEIDPSHDASESSSGEEEVHRGIGFSAPDLTGAHTQRFSDTAPRWRVIHPGLNLEAECKNQDCATAESAGRVWLNFGMGDFKIGREVSSSNCPECKNEFSDKDFVRFGFWKCRFVAKGYQTAPVKGEFTLKDESNRQNGFMKYSEGQATWAYLDIKTKPLNAGADPTPQAKTEESSCIIV